MCRLQNESIQKHLLVESDLKLKKAMDLALRMEAADRNVKSEEKEGMIQKLNAQHTAPSVLYYRCDHAAKDCCFQDAKCNYCQKKAHIVLQSMATTGSPKQVTQKR